MLPDTAERPYSARFVKPAKRSNTIVIDNGTYELRAGFMNDDNIVDYKIIDSNNKGKDNKNKTRKVNTQNAQNIPKEKYKFPNLLNIAVKNKIYRTRDKVSFEPFPLANSRLQFDADVIVNFDALEQTIDLSSWISWFPTLWTG